MSKDFADVKTSIDNVRKDVGRHETRLNGLERQITELRSSGSVGGASTAASAASSADRGPLRFPGFAEAVGSGSGQKKANEKTCVTIGGWDRDTPRATILAEARSFTDTIPDKAADGVFVPLKRASFLKVKFTSSNRMWTWVRSMKGKTITLPQQHHQGRRFWFSVEKSTEEIRVSTMISRAKKEMLDNLGVEASDLELDYVRGIIWWKQYRFGELVKSTGLMSFKEEVATEISAHTRINLVITDFQAKVNAGQ